MLAIRREAVVAVAILALTACGSNDGTGPNNNGQATCSSPVTVGLDQVVTLAPGVTHCTFAGGSAHQEYVLMPFYGSQVNTQSTVLTVTGTGTDALLAPPVANMTPSANMLPNPDVPAGDGPSVLDRGFEIRLRQLERRALSSRVAAARQVMAAPHPSFSAITATTQVGDTVSLNTSLSPCDSPRIHKAVVTAVTNKTVVVADLLNPAGGYTNAEYQSIGTTFDTLVDPLDEQNFGAPTDIDKNGRVVLFFTETVNELTPHGSQSYVGGFFFSRDLLPTSGSTTLYNCPTSNYAEMFYLLVPDPNGVVNGNTFTHQEVAQNTIATTGHEFQHLINASRRFYVNTTAQPFEEVWLNEGLSHIAEELLFYRESGYAPRQDLDVTKLRATTTTANAVNNYQLNNFGRYEELLKHVGKYGPYSNNDSLATRGATWAMLRYLADHHGTSDGTQWQQLVNSTTSGLANLKNVFGTDVMNQIRDWSTSVYTDDLPNVGTAWQQPSWNFRSVIRYVNNNSYPLQMEALAPSSPLSLDLVAGGTAYVQFATAAGKDGQLQFSVGAGQALPPELQFSVIRIQ